MAKIDKDGNTRKKKKHPILLTLLILLLAAIVIGYVVISKALKEYEEENNSAQMSLIGTDAPDFTVTTTDGEELTLSEILKEKEVVVLNIFATWCKPCEREFPEFDELYRKYQDRIEILAISNDSSDTMDSIAEYKADHGLTFPMGYDGDGALAFVPASGYPTTVIIDRYGKIEFCQSGAFPSITPIIEIVTSFLRNGYESTPVYNYIIGPYDKDGYVAGVTLTATADDGSITELTTGEDGFAYIRTNEPHTYTIKVTGVPQGFSIPSKTATAGPQSGWSIIKLQ